MSRVRANASVVVRVGGGVLGVREGESYDENDPVVREHPWLFESPIEEATARPGERRNTRRQS